MNKSVKNLALAALFVALAFVGANLKIFSSIALDSMPAFLGAMMLGPAWGAAIGAIGHLLTAMTSGFPLGLPAHAVVMLMMAATMVVFVQVINLLQKLRLPRLISYALGGAAAVLMNGPLDVMALMPILEPVMGREALMALIPVLSVAAAANIIGAVVIYQLMPRSIRRQGEVYLDSHEKYSNVSAS